MTETRLRLKVVSGITAYNGAARGSQKHKEILTIFNGSGLCPRYKMTVNDPHCATTASVAYIIAGLAGSLNEKGKIFPCVECSCSAMINKAKQAGIWVEADNYRPKPADLILYDWDDGGIGDNKGDPDHVGVVVKVEGNTITVFEGNMGDSGVCGYRTIQINGRYIRGYITPNFKKIATASDTVKLSSTGVMYEYAYKDVLGGASKALAKIPKGTAVIWLRDDGWGWSEIKHNGKTGWIYNSRLNMPELSKFKTYTLKSIQKNAIVIEKGKIKGSANLKAGTKYTLYCEIEHGTYKGKRYIGVGSKRYYI